MDRIGRYEVVRELGTGGMGSVYLGRDPELRRSVALKLLHREQTDYAIKREARVLAALNHPGIVTIFEIGEHEGRQFIAMEYLAGSSLRTLLHASKPPRDEILAICAKVALAVDAAHEAGILHRDIKPENVVVGEKGVVKVVDFGIARRLHGDASLPGLGVEVTTEDRVDALTRTLSFHADGDTVVTPASQTIFGTPAYMAPEVLCGDPATEPSDVYSLGVMLYECLAGRRPFDSQNIAAFIARAIEASDPIPSLDDPLTTFIDRMLAYEARDRPTLAEVARRLDAKRAPSSVPPPAKRSRAPITAALVGVAAICGGIAWKLRAEPQPAPTKPQPLPQHQIVVAIPKIVAAVPSYGAQRPAEDALADALGLVLADRGPLKIIGPHKLGNASPAELGVELTVRGAVVEADGWLDATFEIVDADGKVAHTITRRAQGVAQIAPLLLDIAEQVWTKLVPGVPFDRKPDKARAMGIVDQSKSYMNERAWFPARSYSEFAVLVDPDSFDAWSTNASLRAWSQAPQELIDTAVARTLQLAPEGPRKRIWEGAAHYYHRDFVDALATLKPLADLQGLTDAEKTDLYYYLGEAHWHNGEHDAGYAYFEKCLKVDMKFKPAAVHAGQYAITRRMIPRAKELVHLQSFALEDVDFAAKRYAEIIESNKYPYALYAQLVRGETPPNEDKHRGSPWFDAYLVARALGDGDGARARKAWAILWKEILARPAFTDGTVTELQVLGDLALTGELVDELAQIVAILEAHPSKRADTLRERLVVLGAPLFGRPAVEPHAKMTTRERTTAEAVQAELAGDRARAAKLFGELVANASFTWDYPERAALVRNLHALKRKAELRALCEDSREPAVFQLAYLPLRHTCELRSR